MGQLQVVRRRDRLLEKLRASDELSEGQLGTLNGRNQMPWSVLSLHPLVHA